MDLRRSEAGSAISLESLNSSSLHRTITLIPAHIHGGSFQSDQPSTELPNDPHDSHDFLSTGSSSNHTSRSVYKTSVIMLLIFGLILSVVSLILFSITSVQITQGLFNKIQNPDICFHLSFI